MPFKLLLVILLVLVIFNLFKALVVILKRPSGQSMSTFIGRRLIFSAAILLLLILALAFGWITPHPRPY